MAISYRVGLEIGPEPTAGPGLSTPHLQLPRDAQVVWLVRNVDEQPVGDVRTDCHQVLHLRTVRSAWTAYSDLATVQDRHDRGGVAAARGLVLDNVSDESSPMAAMFIVLDSCRCYGSG